MHFKPLDVVLLIFYLKEYEINFPDAFLAFLNRSDFMFNTKNTDFCIIWKSLTDSLHKVVHFVPYNITPSMQ